ncbi:MAG: hypothetical protein KY432_07185 [Acidobacteria bacterium]|nr:hypothetical protein [Acidobacteriota bacterium]
MARPFSTRPARKAIVSTTGSKRVGSHILRGLSPETSYSITVRTTTHPFGFQQNFLRSAPTAPVSFTTAERQTIPAEVDLVSGPGGLIQIGGVPQNEDSYVLGNFGDVATTITLQQIGDHFTHEPESFVLEPGATRTVRLRSLPNQPPDSYWGYSVVTGDGVPADFLVPVILLSTPPSVGTAIGEAVASRVDVFGPEGTNGVGTVRFRNRGSSTLQGVLVSESAWIRTAPEPITIPAGEVRSVSFDVLRVRRPLLRGAVTGSVKLVYVASGAGKTGVGANDGSTAVSTTLVTVVDTVVPEAGPAAIPALDPGEIRLLIPGASHIVRPWGTFVTDMSVTNAFGAGAVEDLQLFFDRVGNGESSAAAVGSVAPTTSLVLANIVESVYGDADRSGTIHIRSNQQEKLRVEATLSNVTSPSGMMQGLVPVFRTDRVVEPGQSTWLLGLEDATSADTTIFIQEASGSAAEVTIELRNSGGEILGSTIHQLGRFELRELNGAVPSGAHLARIHNHDGSQGTVVAHAIVIDRDSGSVSTLVDWSKLLGYGPGETVRIPFVPSALPDSASAVATVESTGGRRRAVGRPVVPDSAEVRTSASLMNPGSEDAIVELTFHESAGKVYRQRRTVAPGVMVNIEDLSADLRGQSGSGPGFVVVDTILGTSILAAAIVRTTDDVEFSSTIPIIPDSKGLRLGQSVTYTGLEDSTAESVVLRRPSTLRTGFGITETGGRPVTVRATVAFAGKSPLLGSAFSKDLVISPRATFVAPDLLTAVLGEQRDTVLGDVKNVQLTLTVVDGDGAITAFVQESENSSGDTRYRF